MEVCESNYLFDVFVVRRHDSAGGDDGTYASDGSGGIPRRSERLAYDAAAFQVISASDSITPPLASLPLTDLIRSRCIFYYLFDIHIF